MGATTGAVTVTTSGGVATSGTFTVTIAAPSVSGFTPSGAAAGATVQIGGSHLSGATSVRFNGTSAVFTAVNDGQISAIVPAGATSGSISVTTPGGTGSSSAQFTVGH